MKKTTLSKLPEFRGDEEIAAFMEEHDGFELLDAGLAEIVPTTYFVRKRNGRKSLLKNRRVQVAFKDAKSLQKVFSSAFSSNTIFQVIDADPYGLLLGRPDSKRGETFYVPYLNISGIKILGNSKNA
jgi:hypothetical protein